MPTLQKVVRSTVIGILAQRQDQIFIQQHRNAQFAPMITRQLLQCSQHIGNQQKAVLTRMLRVAHRAVVLVPNYGHWRIRVQIMLHGRAPVTGSLPYDWCNWSLEVRRRF